MSSSQETRFLNGHHNNSKQQWKSRIDLRCAVAQKARTSTDPEVLKCFYQPQFCGARKKLLQLLSDDDITEDVLNTCAYRRRLSAQDVKYTAWLLMRYLNYGVEK